MNPQRVVVDEKLKLERRSSRSHNRIVLNIGIALDRQLKWRGCEVFISEMKVQISAADCSTYPDVVVTCGDPQFEDDECDTLLNPTLIIEVLSRTTESYDRTTKFEYYRTLPSFAEYLVLAQDRVHAEHWVRQQGNGGWLFTETSCLDDVLDLPSIGAKLALRDAYDRVASSFG
jgi:Uma2 family endonuclease